MPVSIYTLDSGKQFILETRRDGWHNEYKINAAGRKTFCEQFSPQDRTSHDDACRILNQLGGIRRHFPEYESLDEMPADVLASVVIPEDKEFLTKFDGLMEDWQREKWAKENEERKAKKKQDIIANLKLRGALAAVALVSVLIMLGNYQIPEKMAHPSLLLMAAAVLGFFYELTAAAVSVVGLIVLIKLVA